MIISIHALVKRATAEYNPINNYSMISIHALVKRATGENTQEVKNSGISIHALVKRATTHSGIDLISSSDFNPRPREEGDSKKLSNERNYL